MKLKLIVILILLLPIFSVSHEAVQQSEGYYKIFDNGVYQKNQKKHLYNIYFGNLHSHTSYSDGTGTPAEAFEYARDIADLDFLAVTDHAEDLSDSEWDDIKLQAQIFTEDDVFVAIHGFEWSNPYEGHICVWNSTSRRSVYDRVTWKSFREWLVGHTEAYAGFNHPGREPGVFSDLDYKGEAVDNRMVGIELWNKNDPYTDFFDYYLMALEKGWHLAPTAGQDNHGADWGTKNDIRTAVLAERLTKQNILDALGNRRFYATSDKNLKLYFYANNAPMGSIIGAKNVIFEVSISDGSGDTFTEINLYKDGVIVESKYINASSAVEFFADSVSAQHYYFVEIVQADGDYAHSAPIWVDADEVIVASIHLKEGWNLFSTPLIPVDESIEQFLAPIEGSYKIVQYYDAFDTNDRWKVYDPSKPFYLNDLKHINVTMGIWIYMYSDATLYISGTQPVNVTINLNKGWNLVGYPFENKTVGQVKAELQAVMRIQGFDASVQYLVSDLKDTENLTSGNGYWFFCDSSIVWCGV